MAISAAQMVAAAEAQIETIDVETAKTLISDDQCVFVDIRDIRELWRVGKVSGATHAPRGMLEFWIDPQSPYHREIFAEDKRFIFYCASAWRSALAAQTAQLMGIHNVCHIAGGFTAWQEAGAPTEPVQAKSPA